DHRKAQGLVEDHAGCWPTSSLLEAASADFSRSRLGASQEMNGRSDESLVDPIYHAAWSNNARTNVETRESEADRRGSGSRRRTKPGAEPLPASRAGWQCDRAHLLTAIPAEPLARVQQRFESLHLQIG